MKFHVVNFACSTIYTFKSEIVSGIIYLENQYGPLP